MERLAAEYLTLATLAQQDRCYALPLRRWEIPERVFCLVPTG
jgi:hypothetical protein